MPTITVDLPWPPSANKIWRSGNRRVYRSQKYNSWFKEAFYVFKESRPKKIDGIFSAEIILYPPDDRHSDIDNRIKVLLDLAQKVGVIENDRFCRGLNVVHGGKEAPSGRARLILRSVP